MANMYFQRHARYCKVISACESNRDIDLQGSNAQLPSFELAGEKWFRDANGKAHLALVFKSIIIVYPCDSWIKVVIVDDSYNVTTSRVDKLARSDVSGSIDVATREGRTIAAIQCCSNAAMDPGCYDLRYVISPDVITPVE